MVAALGAAGTCVGAGTAKLLGTVGAAVPLPAVATGTGAGWAGLTAMAVPDAVVTGAGAAPARVAAVAVSLGVPLVVTTLAVPLIAADLRHRRLPDVLTLPAYPILVALAPDPARAVGAAAVFGGLHLLVHLLAPHAMGAGDVKLAGALGAALGWGVGLPAAAVLAALVTAALAATRRWPDGVPHGPGLLAATTTLVLFRPG